jgi:hypothetical protein
VLQPAVLDLNGVEVLTECNYITPRELIDAAANNRYLNPKKRRA